MLSTSELAVLDAQRVTVPPRLQALALAVVKRAPQLADVVLQDLGRRGRRRLTPEGIDQPLARDRLVAVQQQEDEDAALPALAELDGAIPVGDLKRSE